MQGIVIDEESKYVKAAIVKIFKMQDPSDGSDTEAEAVTYALTDENGRFVIWDLDPDENYTIEIHVEQIAAKTSEAAADTDGVADDFIETEKMNEPVDIIETENIDETVDLIETDNNEEDDFMEEDNIDEEDDFMEEDNIDEAEDFMEADNTDEAVHFVQTNSTGDTIFFIQNEELTGMYFASDLKPETELKEKLYAIRNYTW